MALSHTHPLHEGQHAFLVVTLYNLKNKHIYPIINHNTFLIIKKTYMASRIIEMLVIVKDVELNASYILT